MVHLVFDRVAQEIEVPAEEGSSVTIQGVYNEIRIYEALHANMDLRFLANGTGKQALGPNNQIGITLELINGWMLGFEERAGPAFIACVVGGGNLTGNHVEEGTATATGTTVLTDSGAKFAREAIQTGETLRNITDGSSAVVLTVDSETSLTHTPLTGGGSNDWAVNDVWEIDSKHPVFGTAFTHVTISQDAAPVAILTDDLIPDEAHMVVAYDESGTQVRIGAWLERAGAVATAATSCTVTWYDPTGGQLFSVTDNAPDAQGHFRMLITQALAVDTDYYAIVSITDATGTIATRRGVSTSQ